MSREIDTIIPWKPRRKIYRGEEVRLKRGLSNACAGSTIALMGRKLDADPVASALAQKRWDRASKKTRSEEGKRLAGARWAGHVAKRPASSRKKAAK
jgi:hypothetical protein